MLFLGFLSRRIEDADPRVTAVTYSSKLPRRELSLFMLGRFRHVTYHSCQGSIDEYTSSNYYTSNKIRVVDCEHCVHLIAFNHSIIQCYYC
ncbi:hypothetical protein HanRHA438_Chr11g0493111 [Helianthus annuus]|nr:hypothetical protein HanRHA438_Chr11g0493111 [Helianthus annuus]